ncbi:MAG: PAS domain S-box protein [Deltaproteobacteria bacterium]|nr:PAS domain S-box protein [Deltaproteobacteria bacterium]
MDKSASDRPEAGPKRPVESDRIEELLAENRRLEARIRECRKAQDTLRAIVEESERKFGNLMENMPVGIAFTTEDDEILEANAALWKMFGYGSKEEFLKEKASSLYRGIDESGRAAEAIRRGGVKDLDVRARKKDGTEFIGSLTSLVQKAEDGRPRFISLFQDVTEKKMMENEILKAKKLETIGDLAGGIAHDFNNLLVGILGRISVAMEYVEKDGKLHEILCDVEEAALRTKGLTRRLLTFSRGGQPVKEPASAVDLLRSTADLVLRESGVRCEFSFPDGDVYADMDEGQVGQAMNNIILNARQAMDEGGVVEIEARNVTVTGEDPLPIDPGSYVMVSIKDNGRGIPEENLNRVFDPFFTTKQRSSGLGLAVTYSVIKKHRGHITVESKEGGGTTVHVYLPASVGRPLSAPGSPAVERGSGRVLVMDDDEMVRDVAGEMLEVLGYDYSFARDGEEAIGFFKKAIETGEPFDAVILDLTVEDGMGGADAVKKLARIDPGVKAIVSSGYSRDPIMSDYRKHGFCAVIYKPYRLAEFSRAVKDAISAKG